MANETARYRRLLVADAAHPVRHERSRLSRVMRYWSQEDEDKHPRDATGRWSTVGGEGTYGNKFGDNFWEEVDKSGKMIFEKTLAFNHSGEGFGDAANRISDMWSVFYPNTAVMDIPKPERERVVWRMHSATMNALADAYADVMSKTGWGAAQGIAAADYLVAHGYPPEMQRYRELESVRFGLWEQWGSQDPLSPLSRSIAVVAWPKLKAALGDMTDLDKRFSYSELYKFRMWAIEASDTAGVDALFEPMRRAEVIQERKERDAKMELMGPVIKAAEEWTMTLDDFDSELEGAQEQTKAMINSRPVSSDGQELQDEGLDVAKGYPANPQDWEENYHWEGNEQSRGRLKRFVSKELAKSMLVKVGIEALEALGDDLQGHTSDQEPHTAAEGVAGSLVQAWAHHSADSSQDSLAIQLAIADYFGSDDSLSFSNPKTLQGARQVFDKHKKALRAYVEAVYERTQEHFKRNGVTHVNAYRGMHFDESELSDAKSEGMRSMAGRKLLKPNASGPVNPIDPTVPGDEWLVTDAEFEQNPASSYSLSIEIAGAFSTVSCSGLSLMIAARVPVEQVWSTALTGPGCYNESEVVTLGNKPIKGKVLNPANAKHGILSFSTLMQIVKSVSDSDLKLERHKFRDPRVFQ